MIKEIELWDFESHEHTLLNDFSPRLNLFVGESNSGKCLTGDTVVIDRDGSMRTILDMFRQGEWCVPSIRDAMFAWENVSCVAANGNKPVFLLETSKGRKIRATKNHKFFTDRGWVELGELKAGDWIAIARNLPIFGTNKLPVGHARLIGYLLGDGGTIGGLSFTNEEKDVLEDFKRLVLSLEEHHFNSVPAGNATTLTISKPLSFVNRNVDACGLRKFCNNHSLMGFKNNVKKIPDAVFTSCAEDIKDVLLGLFITDGWVCRSGETDSFQIGFSTTSRVMAHQISHLLTRFGIVSTVRRKKTTWEYLGEKKRGWAYAVEVGGQRFVRKFGDVFGFGFVGKKSKLLQEAVESYDLDRIICRYDGVPRTEKMIDMIRSAINRSKKSESEIRNQMGLHHRTSLIGSSKNSSFGMVFLQRLADVTNSDDIRNVVNSDLYWDKVKNIRYEGVEPTFDIEVPHTHTFFANDIYTHNTSIIRAIKLVSYNDFDPRSVRIGAKNCKVRVTTDKGVVQVTRGKDNIWEVTKNGCETHVFEKVGQAIVPEAAEIMGLKIVSLGDVDVPVNIMDQLESHFMLAGVGDKNASGSMRAQIIDEISGLSGIEGLIKDVALDYRRFGHEMKELEVQTEETRKLLHDESELLQEESVLNQAEKHITKSNQTRDMAEIANALHSKGCVVIGELNDLKDRQSKIPDSEKALRFAKQAEEKSNEALNAQKTFYTGTKSQQELDEKRVIIGKIPDVSIAVEKISVFEKTYRTVGEMIRCFEGSDKCIKELATKKERDTLLPDIVLANKKIEASKEAQEVVVKAVSCLQQAIDLKHRIELQMERITSKEAEIIEAEKEKAEILLSVKTCPLTLKPIGNCLTEEQT